MKIILDLEYIGETEIDFGTKLDLFEYYFNNDGRIMDINPPYFDEYFDEYRPQLLKISRPERIINVNLDIEDNLEQLLNTIKDVVEEARLENLKCKSKTEEFKNKYKIKL